MSKYVEIIKNFQTDYSISGICPFNDYIVIMAHIEETVQNESTKNKAVRVCTSHCHFCTTNRAVQVAQRPEIRIVTFDGQEVSSDVLSLHDFDKYTARQYRLGAHISLYNSTVLIGHFRAHGR